MGLNDNTTLGIAGKYASYDEVRRFTLANNISKHQSIPNSTNFYFLFEDNKLYKPGRQA